jgi:hypothetical protein
MFLFCKPTHTKNNKLPSCSTSKAIAFVMDLCMRYIHLGVKMGGTLNYVRPTETVSEDKIIFLFTMLTNATRIY